MAKLYAKMGFSDRSLEYLRKALEEGYKDLKNVYKDTEFAELRKDKRFTELMATKTRRCRSDITFTQISQRNRLSLCMFSIRGKDFT